MSVVIWKGTNTRVFVYLKDEDGSNLDLTSNSSIKLQVGTTTALATASLTLNASMTVYGDPSGGAAYYDVTIANTSSLTAQTYLGQIKVTYASGVVRKSDVFEVLLYEGVEAAA